MQARGCKSHGFLFVCDMIFGAKPTWMTRPKEAGVIERVKIPRFFSRTLARNMVLELFLPINYRQNRSAQYPVLIVNDGQDAKGLALRDTLSKLQNEGAIQPIVVCAIHTIPERKHLYGVANNLDYKGRGKLAARYTKFITEELMSYLHTNWRVQPSNKALHGIFGCSLGGLAAIDTAWHNPQLFGVVGVCSGSFWYRSVGYEDGYTDADRIILHVISKDERRPAPQPKIWLQTGTLDELADRNNDGIIDAIGDTLDLMEVLKGKGHPQEKMRYLEVEGGRHDVPTWAAVLPDFLVWAFGKKG